MPDRLKGDPADIAQQQAEERVDRQIAREERLVENYPEQWFGVREP